MQDLTPIEYDTYFEPFIGAGCLFFALEPRKAFISDANNQLIRTYKSIRNEPALVSKYLESIPKTREAFYALRSICPTALSNAQSAARFIYLMKSCFNGVYRENKQGFFNTPWGGKVYKLPSLEDFNMTSSILKDIELNSLDFETAVIRATEGDFVYLDPPYPQQRYRGEFGLGPFAEKEIARLGRVCQELSRKKVKVMVSYVEDSRLTKLLDGWETVKVDSKSSVGGKLSSRQSMREIILRNYTN